MSAIWRVALSTALMVANLALAPVVSAAGASDVTHLFSTTNQSHYSLRLIGVTGNNSDGRWGPEIGSVLPPASRGQSSTDRYVLTYYFAAPFTSNWGAWYYDVEDGSRSLGTLIVDASVETFWGIDKIREAPESTVKGISVAIKSNTLTVWDNGYDLADSP